jgi:transcriptional regulator with PAS, ATPase and Fis domain
MLELEKYLLELAEFLDGKKREKVDETTLDEIYQQINQLKKENEMLNTALDNCADNFHVTDGQGNILRVNRAFEKHCKVNRGFVEGKTIHDMEKLGVYRPSMTAVAIREKREITVLQKVASGDMISTITPIMDERDEVRYVVSNSRSISELQLLNKYYQQKPTLISDNGDSTSEIICQSPAMQEVKEMAMQVAKSESSILITGETGSGKSMLAKYIHQHSTHSKGRFIEINCAAIPESLFEAELFGYASGAFTGAKQGGKYGLIELANNGTLFLDEIGDMSLAIQAKLLNVLQNREIIRVGGETAIPVNIRVIAATNSDLTKLIQENKFRVELYYRLNVVPLAMPPLRSRREDIVLLTEHFLRRFCEMYKTDVLISKEALDRLAGYVWPGNIRELENLMERLVVTDNKGVIEVDDLPSSLLIMTGDSNDLVTVNRIAPLKEVVEEVERQLVTQAYEKYNSSYKIAAVLEISQSSAMRRIQKYT